MPKFLVTKCVDAFANYKALIDAEDESEAVDLAKADDGSIQWHADGVSEFQEEEFENIMPECVSDDL